MHVGAGLPAGIPNVDALIGVGRFVDDTGSNSTQYLERHWGCTVYHHSLSEQQAVTLTPTGPERSPGANLGGGR